MAAERTGPASGLAGRIRPFLPAFAVGLAGVLALRRFDQTDAWWHLAAGRWIAAHGRVPHTDVLSYTVPDHAWTNLQWLFDLALFGLYRLGGVDLIDLVTALVFAATFALFARNVGRQTGALATTLWILWVLLPAEERFQTRPEMLSLFWLQLLLWILGTADARRSGRLWGLPVVMLFWVNTHSLFILGVYAVLCHMAAAAAGRLPGVPERLKRGFSFGAAPPRAMLVCGGAALGATLFNPYFLDGLVFPFELMSRINGSVPAFRMIGEFGRPFSGFFSTWGIGAYQVLLVFDLIVVAAACVAALTADARPAGREAAGKGRGVPRPAAEGTPFRLDLAGLLLFCGLAYLSVLARRNMALFALGTTPLVAACVHRLAARYAPPWWRRSQAVAAPLVLALPPLLLAAAWFVANNGFYWWTLRAGEFGLGTLEVMFPIRATEFVREMKLPGRLYNDMDTGGYLSWERPFPEGVYLDGRLEVYDAEFFTAHGRSLSDMALWQAEADRWGVSTVMIFHRWGNRRKLITWLAASPDWARVYVDEVVVLFVRRAGNEEVVRAATERFAQVAAETERRLLAPVDSWQWPVNRAQEVSNYAVALAALGEAERALPFYVRYVEFGPPPTYEFPFRADLAAYLAGQGETEKAREHLRRAIELDPTNPALVELRARLGVP